MKRVISAVLFGVATCLAQGAQATLLLFTISGDYTAQFVADSNPTPDFKLDGYSITLSDVPGVYDGVPDTGYLEFYNEDFLGGMNVSLRALVDPLNQGGPSRFTRYATEIGSIGPQIYSGPEAAPVFAPGVFQLEDLFGSADAYTLTIVPFITAIPEPASWAMMIAGFGLVGAAMRGRQQRTVIAFP